MTYMLDTNSLIYLIKHRPPGVAERMNALPKDNALRMSFVTYAELLKGAERSTRKADVLHRLDLLIRQIPVCYPIDAGICRHYARQFTRLKAAGTLIGGNDLWIAAHALALDVVLVTSNVREFERVSGLKVENWAVTV